MRLRFLLFCTFSDNFYFSMGCVIRCLLLMSETVCLFLGQSDIAYKRLGGFYPGYFSPPPHYDYSFELV